MGEKIRGKIRAFEEVRALVRTSLLLILYILTGF